MLSDFQWVSLWAILGVAAAGGWLPLAHPERARSGGGFPLGQAFAAGVFLALALLIMLPAGNHLLGHAFPAATYPVAPLLAACVFLFLLAVDHLFDTLRTAAGADTVPAPPFIPVLMTAMIAIPSFLLGTALGASGMWAAVMIFVAIMAHKGSAGFALALKLARSTLSRGGAIAVYALFACSTPLGILVGGDLYHVLGGQAMLVAKGLILSLAGGTFLYLAVLHELKHTALIIDVDTKKGFVLMLAGFVLTALVRLLLWEAHHFHPGL